VPNQWIEVTLQMDGEAAEAAAELLSRYGYQGVAIEQGGIPPDKLDDDELPTPAYLILRAYVPADGHVDEVKAQLETALGYMNMMYPMPTPTYRAVSEEDWAEAWKAHYHPLKIGKRLFIRPQWVEIETEPGQVVVSLDPGMAFGTGTHPTTQLCLEALEELVTPDVQVLDLGCGSGILSIAAVKLGAGHALAVDIDAVAVEASQKNAVENGTADRMTIEQGSLEQIVASGQQFDLVAANILARIIITMCGQGLGEVVRPGGIGIFSGIIEEQAADVEAALRTAGLEPYTRRQMGDWVVIEARRRNL